MSELYKIANEYASLMSEDLDPEIIADTLEGIEFEFEQKVEQLLAVIKNTAALSDALKAESKSLAERAKAADNRIDSIKRYIAECMEKTERKKITAGIHSLTVRAPSQSVEIEDCNLLPVELVEYETTAKPDKNAIKALLKSGAEVPGASLKYGKPSLIIK